VAPSFAPHAADAALPFSFPIERADVFFPSRRRPGSSFPLFSFFRCDAGGSDSLPPLLVGIRRDDHSSRRDRMLAELFPPSLSLPESRLLPALLAGSCTMALLFFSSSPGDVHARRAAGIYQPRRARRVLSLFSLFPSSGRPDDVLCSADSSPLLLSAAREEASLQRENQRSFSPSSLPLPLSVHV